MTQILEPKARERCTYILYFSVTISLVKKEKIIAIENHFIQLANSNRLFSKVTEKQLIQLISSINSQTQNSNNIVIILVHLEKKYGSDEAF